MSSVWVCGMERREDHRLNQESRRMAKRVSARTTRRASDGVASGKYGVKFSPHHRSSHAFQFPQPIGGRGRIGEHSKRMTEEQEKNSESSQKLFLIFLAGKREVIELGEPAGAHDDAGAGRQGTSYTFTAERKPFTLMGSSSRQAEASAGSSRCKSRKVASPI